MDLPPLWPRFGRSGCCAALCTTVCPEDWSRDSNQAAGLSRDRSVSLRPHLKPPTSKAQFQFDPAGVEMERFKFLAPEEVQPFLRADGLHDEFKMMYFFRHRFPLHYFIFKQTASHLPHEANVEQGRGSVSPGRGICESTKRSSRLSVLHLASRAYISSSV